MDLHLATDGSEKEQENGESNDEKNKLRADDHERRFLKSMNYVRAGTLHNAFIEEASVASALDW